MKKLPYALIICLFCLPLDVAGQVNSRNGYWMPQHDTLRFLIIFAEMVDDPADPQGPGSEIEPPEDNHWLPGEMPDNPEVYLDPIFANASSISSDITRWYYEMSFGKFIVLGDYLPELIQVDWSSIIPNDDGQLTILKQLKDYSGSLDLPSGLPFDTDFFDKWTKTSTTPFYGLVKSQTSDDYLDGIIVIWRTNSKFTGGNNSGKSSGLNSSNPMFGFEGPMMQCHVINWYSSGSTGTILHELNHQLYGDNTFHMTAGAGYPNGARALLHIPGGYSALATDARNFSGICNAWDRHRIGWKPDGNSYYISARRADNYQEIDADFVYNQTFTGTNEFLLRDFSKYGDAIRIKLPYLNSSVEDEDIRDQYLWLENHQQLSGHIDHPSRLTKGVTAFIQAGKDDMEFFTEKADYLTFLTAFGNYDFELETEPYFFNVLESQNNPFTGNNWLTQPLYDKNSSSTLEADEIFESEGVKINGVTDPDLQDPIYGTEYDAFVAGDLISIGTNPTPTPLLTYETPLSGLNVMKQDFDNRTIHLNGISIEFLEAINNPNGDGKDIKVRIRWNNWEVDNNVRWCGPIKLHDTIELQSNKTIHFDQGLSAQKPNNPISFNGQNVFADPTVFTCLPNSYFHLDPYSDVIIDNGSTLIVEADAKLEVHSGARVIG